jgi:ABC-2 type transport system ATP-binding protein
MIKVKNLTKKFGDKLAVDSVSFEIPNNKVVGFLGPNGAGKTTTMRCILGLENCNDGYATIDNNYYDKIKYPLFTVGALIDSKAYHKSRSAFNHLKTIAETHGISNKRINEVLDLTGLTKVKNKKVGKYSLGMVQRLGIAAALLGKPKNLILDEPVNGLDPEGVIWIRNLAKIHASDGGCVLISSHLMSEVENTVDDVVIIGKGKILKMGEKNNVIKETGSKTLEEAYIKLSSNSTEYTLKYQGEDK